MRSSKKTHRFKADVAYDGTGFSGWQVQPGQRTVQAELERAITELTGETVRVNCSGRTDTGVNAIGQVVHFDLATPFLLRRLFLALNAKLPPEVRVMRIQRAAADFDARFSAIGKEYRYFIWNGPQMPPHLRHQRAHVRHRLNLRAMREAASYLVGEHDFASFSANPGHERNGTVRIIHALTISRRGGDVTISVRGGGFLYRMVRSLAGFLIRVGVGDLEPSVAREIIDSKVRTARVPTAPAQGLFLWQVFYSRRR